MAAVYPELATLVVVDAGGPKDRLNAEVWRHARLAEQRGLALVVEVYARSVLASRRLTEWWKSGDTLMRDTLTGVYLLRVDLQTFGPEAVIKLTPYAVVGAPLFVGWNPVGQVCSRSQFEELTPEAMALPLSAFVEDVLAGRAHSLNPVPSLGSAERTREAAALRRVGQALAVRQAPTESASKALPDQTQEGGADAEAPAGAPRVASVVTEDAPSESVSPVERLLANARHRFVALEDRVGFPLRLQLEDLRAIDQWLHASDDAARLAFAREFGAVLAVYVGDTIIGRVRADWVWDAASPTEAAKLTLVGEVLGSELRTQPLEWVIETLSDDARSVYGQALAWCRIV